MQKIPKGTRNVISFLLCQVLGFILVLVVFLIGVGMVSILKMIGWDTTGTTVIVIGLCVWLWFVAINVITEIIVDKLY